MLLPNTLMGAKEVTVAAALTVMAAGRVWVRPGTVRANKRRPIPQTRFKLADEENMEFLWVGITRAFHDTKRSPYRDGPTLAPDQDLHDLSGALAVIFDIQDEIIKSVGQFQSLMGPIQDIAMLAHIGRQSRIRKNKPVGYGKDFQVHLGGRPGDVIKKREGLLAVIRVRERNREI